MTNRYSIFLCGDVMLGRGIDQILPHPSVPRIFESYVKDARDYILLAEQMNGKILYPVPFDYIWGEALEIWRQEKPDIKIINLETALTQSEQACPEKGIHYRMHPDNIAVLQAASFDICTIANNHVMDWGITGLEETIHTLKSVSFRYAGAGNDNKQASVPAIHVLSNEARVLVFAAALKSSGVPAEWAAGPQKIGVNLLADLSPKTLTNIAANIQSFRQNGDLLIFSIHWGSNWGYEVSPNDREFAHHLIDLGFDVILGHSSHHPRPIEFYKNKPIFYGCGDFINDYEGIRHEHPY
jgi:poly-gamma-glutamate capsule biosynthesis protein CapA/YwtB (metallophosphatase superfamily)